MRWKPRVSTVVKHCIRSTYMYSMEFSKAVHLQLSQAKLRLYALLFDRLLLAYLMIPIVQREVNTFIDVVWNSHRIREQKNTFLPDGVPNHIYSFPDKYGLEECGRYLYCVIFQTQLARLKRLIKLWSQSLKSKPCKNERKLSEAQNSTFQLLIGFDFRVLDFISTKKLLESIQYPAITTNQKNEESFIFNDLIYYGHKKFKYKLHPNVSFPPLWHFH